MLTTETGQHQQSQLRMEHPRQRPSAAVASPQSAFSPQAVPVAAVESHVQQFVELPSDPGLQKVVCPPEHFIVVSAPDLSRALAGEVVQDFGSRTSGV